MLVCKLFEVRDKGTFLPVFAIRMKDQIPLTSAMEGYLLRRAGFSPNGQPFVLFGRATGGGAANYDPYNWGDRTMHTAHMYVTKNWDDLEDGQVICVEHIFGERENPKTSEAFE